jgi:hypothetical protein
MDDSCGNFEMSLLDQRLGIFPQQKMGHFLFRHRKWCWDTFRCTGRFISHILGMFGFTQAPMSFVDTRESLIISLSRIISFLSMKVSTTSFFLFNQIFSDWSGAILLDIVGIHTGAIAEIDPIQPLTYSTNIFPPIWGIKNASDR